MSYIREELVWAAIYRAFALIDFEFTIIYINNMNLKNKQFLLMNRLQKMKNPKL
jgi:disulfide oxidoreductase YuzD